MRAVTGATLAAIAGGAWAQETTQPVPLSSPASWITAEDYPPDAIRARAEGRVVATLGIDATGRVTSCAVRASSGNAMLDAATCAVMTTRGRFKPATGPDGKPVPSSYTMPVRWSLPQGTAAPPVEITAATKLDMEIAVELNLDGDGKLLTCRVVAETMPSFATGSARPCAQFGPGVQVAPGLRRGGRPVASKVIQRMTRRVELAP